MFQEVLGRMGLQTITRTQLSVAFERARGDLAEVGLLAEGRYLGRIGCAISPLPTGGELPFGRGRDLGYFFDEGVGRVDRTLGYREGVIYVPPNPQVATHTPGATLLDALRHEFAHAWAWIDRAHVDGPWFHRAFGARYGASWAPGEAPEFEPSAFVSEYATEAPKEDFAETFMAFLKYRHSLARYDRRPGLRRKITAVRVAVGQAAQRRVGRVRGPRA